MSTAAIKAVAETVVRTEEKGICKSKEKILDALSTQRFLTWMHAADK
jgi:hypothetical protein